MTSELPLLSIHNLRPVGRAVDRTALLRSADWSQASDWDLHLVEDHYAVRTYIDLRTATERAQFGVPRVLATTEDLHLPLFDDQTVRGMYEYPSLGEFYIAALSASTVRSRLSQVIEQVAASMDVGSVVVACSAGKDRTGLVAASILMLIGDTDQHIVDDYALTGPVLESLYRRWSENPRSEILQHVRDYPDHLGAPKRAMEAVLAHQSLIHLPIAQNTAVIDRLKGLFTTQ